MTFQTIPASGQTARKRLTSDFGLMADVQLASDFINANVGGVQYRHQTSSWLAWRCSAGYLSLRDKYTDVALFPTSPDTMRRRRIDRVMTGLAVGFGLEMERQFYKGIYFYFGTELRAAYGNALTDTQLTTNYAGPSPFPPDSSRYQYSFASSRESKKGNGIAVSATLLLGVRLYAGKRFILGTEFSNPLYYLNSKTGDEQQRNSGIDASLDHVMQRFYVSYRFK